MAGLLGIEDKIKDYLLGALALLFMAAAVYCTLLRADNKALGSQVGPLKQAAQDAAKLSEGYRTALGKCEQEKLSAKQANERALGEAQDQRAAADARAEDYFKQLQHPGDDCAAITRVKVCPRLMGY